MFEGWYTARVGGQKYDFSTPVTSNLTLYAHWSTYVYFDTGCGASYVPAQRVIIGERLTKPEDPVDQTWNNEFDCWCTDEELTQPFDFNTPITGATRLYAKWVVYVPVNVSTGIRGVTMNAFWAPVGKKIDLPDPPANPDYEFLGWYYYPASGGGLTPVDENTVVTDDWNGRSIYARWTWKQHYSYEVYYLDGRGGTWYTGTSRTMFVKTNNPSAQTIGIQDSTPQSGDFSQRALQMFSFDDVTPLEWDSNCLKVPGGFLVSFIYEGDQRGSTPFQIVEYADPNGDVYSSSLAKSGVAVRTINVNVVGGSEARQRWINETIEKYTTDSMTPPEKMSAICKGILRDFTYMTTFEGEDGYASLVTDPDSPFWVTKRWDSYTSPAMLCEIAETIGGFTDIKNHYGDYPVGSPDWSANHYYASMKYNGEEYWHEACPMSYTNEISRDDVKMVDFTDTSSMQLA